MNPPCNINLGLGRQLTSWFGRERADRRLREIQARHFYSQKRYALKAGMTVTAGKTPLSIPVGMSTVSVDISAAE